MIINNYINNRTHKATAMPVQGGHQYKKQKQKLHLIMTKPWHLQKH